MRSASTTMFGSLTSHGVDVSHWQGPLQWDTYRDDGGEFVIIKHSGANTGRMYVSDSINTHHEDAKDAGMKVGYYYVVNGHLNALDQAKFFVDNVSKIIAPGDIVCLDNESLDRGIRFDARQSRVWLEYVAEELDITPFFYSYPSLIRSIDWGDIPHNFPLWLAAFNRNDGTTAGGWEKHVDQWEKPTIWQYSSNGRVEGYGSRIDVNLALPGIFDRYGYKSTDTSEPVEPAPAPVEGDLELPKTAIDGIAGPITWKRLQVWLKEEWGYAGRIDGVPGPMTWKAMQRFANSL